MSGYTWAKTAAGELLVVLMSGEKGYVPGVENAIDLAEIELLEPVEWPTAITPRSRNLLPLKFGALAPDAMRECAILPFVARG